MISVHRLELLMQPRFYWLLLELQASLYSMYGVPVSIYESMICSQSQRALTDFLARPSFSYFSYNASNFAPQQSKRPGHSCGHIRDHS